MATGRIDEAFDCPDSTGIWGDAVTAWPVVILVSFTMGIIMSLIWYRSDRHRMTMEEYRRANARIRRELEESRRALARTTQEIERQLEEQLQLEKPFDPAELTSREPTVPVTFDAEGGWREKPPVIHDLWDGF